MSKAQIKFYKGVCLVKIQDKLNLDGANICTDEVDQLIKFRADLDKSTEEMNLWEMHGLIDEAIEFGKEIGIEIKLPSER